MLETNIRIINPGIDLYLNVRRATIIGQDVTADIVQRVCGTLRYRYKVAAVPSFDPHEVFVVSRDPIKPLVLEEKNLYVEVQDSGQSQVLRFRNVWDRALLAQLFERGLLVQLERRSDLWRLDSPRIWYKKDPFTTSEDIAAYRRYEISSIPIEAVGIGLIVEISTAFFTTLTVADFFRSDLSKDEQEKLLERFEFLTERQQGQKGTLLYNNGSSYTKCYFDKFSSDMTCGTTAPFRLNDQTYTSLVDYYQRVYQTVVAGHEPVAKVSFPNIDRPQPVAANMLRLRVMNDSLPPDLKNIDKIDPEARAASINEFWDSLEQSPLGKEMPKVSTTFWRPSSAHTLSVQAPNLLFADGRILAAPQPGSYKEYKNYYRQRKEFLNELGCYSVPPTVSRLLFVAVPKQVPHATAKRLADDIAKLLSQWTRTTINWEIVPYANISEAFALLGKKATSGQVLFVFEDEDPASYYTVAYELKAWRVKRITFDTLRFKSKQLHLLDNGSLKNNPERAQQIMRSWHSFIEMNALDILQLMDCVPWTIAESLHYDGQLAIDVGAKHRFYALSLVLCRPQPAEPSFYVDTFAVPKQEKQETINSHILAEDIVNLCEKSIGKNFTPLQNLLALRDGRECGDELTAISSTGDQLIEIGFLAPTGRIDVVDVHKQSVKGMRLWNNIPYQERQRALEGSAVILDPRTVLLVNTGAASLPQGTAEPLLLVAHNDTIDMQAVASDVHALSQLNWSSPGKAQRLPMALKRTDDELKNRAAQEVRRIK